MSRDIRLYLDDIERALLKTDNTVAWSTKTSGNTGAILSVQDDGNLVVYKRDSCSAAWARR